MGASPLTDGGIRPTPTIDSTVPRSARVWNHLLGGKDNYPVDRTLGDAILRASPGLADVARTSREFLGRAIRRLAGEVGIRQFLDTCTHRRPEPGAGEPRPVDAPCGVGRKP